MSDWLIQMLYNGGHRWLAILIALMGMLFGWFYFFYLQPQRHPSSDCESNGGIADRNDLAVLLRRMDQRDLYHHLTLRILRWGDLLYAGIDRTDEPDRGGWRGLFFTNKGNWQGIIMTRRRIQPFLISVSLSLAYSLGSFMATYAFLGGSGSIGALEIFRSDAPNWLRFLAIFWILTWPFWANFISKKSKLLFYRLFSISVSDKVAISLSMILLLGISAVFATNISGAGLGGGIGIVLISAGLVGSTIGTGIFVTPFLIFLVFFEGLSSSSFISILLFFFILPFINAFFDWISRAFSRRFMRYLVEDKRTKGSERYFIDILCIIFDFILGVAFLLGLIAMLVWGFDTAVLLTGNTEFDWRPLAATARDYPFTQGFFVTFMLFTTLFPTFVHLVIHIFALSANLVSVNTSLIDILERPDVVLGAGARRRIALNLTLRWTLAALVGIGGIFGGLFTIGYLAGVGQVSRALHTFAICISNSASTNTTCLGHLIKHNIFS